MFRSRWTPLALLLASIAYLPATHAGQEPSQETPPTGATTLLQTDATRLRLAINDLIRSFGAEYPEGPKFLARLDAIEHSPTPHQQQQLNQLRNQALLANPLLDFDRLIVLKRARGQLGLPTNHQCNTSLPQRGYLNEFAILSPVQPGGKLHTLYRPADDAFVGELDLDFDARHILFTMPNGQSWQIHELDVATGEPRQVTRPAPDVDNFDPCYLPDGRILFSSTASFTAVPCWHGRERACSLYSMSRDGTGVRQLGFDQDLDLHPSVLPNGQVVYSRWDYTGIMHVYLRPLMVMNPDGSSQRSVYGSNSYYPNSLFFPRAVPNSSSRLVAILAGYHGPNRMGELVVLDTSQGWREEKGILHRIGHRDEPIVPTVRDNLIGDSWPKFLHPYPLSDQYLLVSAQLAPKASWGVYLVDIFDNFVPLALDPAFDFFEPTPLRPRPRPPALPSRIDPGATDALIYVHDVYAGPGLQGVPRDSVKKLRLAAYNFGYPGLAGPDKIGHGGPWEAIRILGTVPVETDGSASFRVPASTPLTIQPLDAEGKALAVMRSWYTAMPGEVASCVGCHESPNQTPITRLDLAATRPPSDIAPWYGPARGFDFEREVQPVLDRHCVSCHDSTAPADKRALPDLRAERFFPAYQGLPLTQLGASRLHPALLADVKRFPPNTPDHRLIGDRKSLYTPSYDALAPYIRRVNIEDYVGLLNPAEYHADTSELVQLLRKGHHGVRLDPEAWDRLITWIDLNGPCHGTWNDIAPIPEGADKRRLELARRQGGPQLDPEQVPPTPSYPRGECEPPPVLTRSLGEGVPRETPASFSPLAPLDPDQARALQQAAGPWQQAIDLGEGVTLPLVKIPAGSFVMGTDDGPDDEYPPSLVSIESDFWMGAAEVTNAQFRRFDPTHFSGLFMKRSLSVDGPGIDMNRADQPAVRVSFDQAAAFCRWLSDRTGDHYTLPTEAEWEYACRAGSTTPLSYGDTNADFSPFANLADDSLSRIHNVTGGVLVMQDFPADRRFDDGGIATLPVAAYKPNPWGLFDMHGNAAEWTASTYRPYPYQPDQEPAVTSAIPRRHVVRGGSFYDRPTRARSSFRLDYPAWQRVHNVGFRVVLRIETQAHAHASAPQ